MFLPAHGSCVTVRWGQASTNTKERNDDEESSHYEDRHTRGEEVGDWADELKPKHRSPRPPPLRRKRAEKLSAIDAAAKVLAESKEPMSTKQMIEAMAEQKLWTSPGGKTPERTLYSAVLREINTKGKESRFQKTERGKFTAKTVTLATTPAPTPHVGHVGAFSCGLVCWPARGERRDTGQTSRPGGRSFRRLAEGSYARCFLSFGTR